MAKITYNKLIRDRIPEIIEKDGKRYAVETMPPGEYEKALLDKLVEEAQEAQQADELHLKTELADILEVVDALLIQKGISRQAVRGLQRQRRSERGGFEKRLKLLWTE
ncbi:MAG: nucleoside triphosphate pyrophosphohydrolase [Anaerolineales bacterium]|nr:nucleoside triphosphate pyrophosphohydrolase [Anaerolineales bacterium]